MITILVVDDSKSICEFCKAELESEGYRVLVARDGLEALEVLSRGRPDLVILDVHMPRMDGLEAFERIRAMNRDTVVVFYTAHHKDHLNDVQRRHAVACVEKSPDLTELKRAIVSALETTRDGTAERVRTRQAQSSLS